MSTWVREFDESGELPLEKAVAKLRDEVTGIHMGRHRGNSRELGMLIAKLDEAHHWAVSYGLKTGRLTLVTEEQRQAATNFMESQSEL